MLFCVFLIFFNGTATTEIYTLSLHDALPIYRRRVRQLIDDHKRLSDLCAELTAQRDTLRSEKRTLEERVRELDAELARMQLTEGLAGGGRNREKARARVNRLMREVDKCIALLRQQPAAPEAR